MSKCSPKVMLKRKSAYDVKTPNAMQDWVQQSRDSSANHSGWHKLAPSPAPPHMPDMAVPSVRPVSHSMFASGQRPDPLTKRKELDETEKAKRWHANDCKCRVSEKHGKRAQQISKQRMCKKGKWRVQIWSMHHAQPQETHSVVIITYCHSRKHTHTHSDLHLSPNTRLHTPTWSST